MALVRGAIHGWLRGGHHGRSTRASHLLLPAVPFGGAGEHTCLCSMCRGLVGFARNDALLQKHGWHQAVSCLFWSQCVCPCNSA